MAPAKSALFRLDEQPEVFFSHAETSRAVNYEVNRGRARPIARGLYTRNLSDPIEEVLRRNWVPVTAEYFPGAVLVDRTAFEFQPAEDGSVMVSSSKRRDVQLPGLRLRAREGPMRLAGDERWMGEDIFMSSRARAFLDNMRPSRARQGVPRTLSHAELEEKLDAYAGSDVEQLNSLRDDARRLAPDLGAESEFQQLDNLIGALLGTRDAPLASESGKARAAGVPYDKQRLVRFEQLQTHLLSEPPQRLAANLSHERSTLAFFEAYFSNFIEGTEFTLDEAEKIVFDGVIPSERPRDAHDILGTYRLVSADEERSRTPTSADELIDIIKSQHAVLMEARPDMRPGEFKEKPNRAGSTLFVLPEHVEGTLRQGFAYYDTLPKGLARAIFAMFSLAEIHPFVDGNGRIARVLVNSELSAVSEQRIIVPTASRDDYLYGLRGMTQNANARSLVRVMESLQDSARATNYSSRETAELDLRRRGAFG
ncbi:MAG: Fic family protein [Thermoleophilaceae bacterium]